jgi:excisionase family DNA binding protein
MDVTGPEKGSRLLDDQCERLLTPEQVAERLAIGRTHTYLMLAEKQLPSIKIGKLRRVREADLNRFIQERLNDEAHCIEAGG